SSCSRSKGAKSLPGLPAGRVEPVNPSPLGRVPSASAAYALAAVEPLRDRAPCGTAGVDVRAVVGLRRLDQLDLVAGRARRGGVLAAAADGNRLVDLAVDEQGGDSEGHVLDRIGEAVDVR